MILKNISASIRPAQVFIFLVVALVNCKSTKTNSSYPLVGSWQYMTSSGGFTGKMAVWEPNSNVMIEFTKNSKYKRSENNKITIEDNFTLKRAKSMVSGEEENLIGYTSNSPDQSYRISNDTLYLRDEIADGFSYIFVRK
jgi:hypothetical protein